MKKLLHVELKATLNIPVYADDHERAIAKGIQIAGAVAQDMKWMNSYTVGKAWVINDGSDNTE